MDPRLKLVAGEVPPGGCHADIGTDHALLPLYLLDMGICPRVIATEKSPSAFRIAKQALWGREADLRLGDGLEVLEPGECQSLSVCGLGGSNIAEILLAGQEKLPDIVLVQANKDTFKVRKWARNNGFHLLREHMVKGTWLYEILTLIRKPGPDPAYSGLPEPFAERFGPHLLRESHPLLLEDLKRRLSDQSRYKDNPYKRMLLEALALWKQVASEPE